MQLIEFQKFRITIYEWKNLSVAVMSGCSFNRKELQLSHLKPKRLHPQVRLATLTYDKQIKLVHYLVKHATVLPSQKDDCHPVLAGFGNDYFSFRNIDTGRKIIIKPLESFSVENVEPFQSY